MGPSPFHLIFVVLFCCAPIGFNSVNITKFFLKKKEKEVFCFAYFYYIYLIKKKLMKKLILAIAVVGIVNVVEAKSKWVRVSGAIVSAASVGVGAAFFNKAPGAGGIAIVAGGGGLLTLGLNSKGRARNCSSAYRF